LKIKSANTSFLKIDDANNQFLRLGATAANTNEFGGATPESFSRSASGAIAIPSINTGPAQALLGSPDGAITVKVGITAGVGGVVTIANGTNQTPAVQDLGGQVTQADIPALSFSTIALGNTSAAQPHVQFFPVPGLFFSATPEAATLIVSQETTQSTHSFVGQLIAGSL
jgi:hypothetical protein